MKNHIELAGKTILITGAAGFISANLAKRVLHDDESVNVVGLDNMNAYYDVRLKEDRLKELEQYPNFTFVKGDLADKPFIDSLFEQHDFAVVMNLGAQAGVRYSITNPDAYVQSNLIGFYNILEACRHYPVEHLVYASSSSVYGGNKKVLFSTDDKVDNPVSLYAATKKSNELMAHAYSKLYDIPSTGLRFFTVYRPAGRPDMAYFGFTNKLRAGDTIKIFNYGNCQRDFTYVDDIVEGITRVMQGAPARETGEDGLPVSSLCAVQHRRRPPGEPARLRDDSAGGTGPCRRASVGLRFRGSQGACAHAAGRCARHLCGHEGAGGGFRVSSVHHVA